MSTGGNVYDKYGTTNPIERRLVEGFIVQLEQLVRLTGAEEAHEVGCGEGELSIRLARSGVRVRGSELHSDTVAEARRRAKAAEVQIPFKAAAVEDLDPVDDSAELIVCCEVMEHLPDPAHALAVIAELARPWAIVSVPREPLWRALNLARGKYARDLGNTPGHLNHWSRGAFVRFLHRRLEVVEIRSPLPWTMALCRARDGRTTVPGPLAAVGLNVAGGEREPALEPNRSRQGAGLPDAAAATSVP